MNERLSARRPFEVSVERLGRCHMVTLQFANSHEREASTQVEAQIAAWVNEGGAGGEVRR